MGTIRLFKVWLVIGLMVLGEGSLAYAQNIFPGSGSVGIGTTSPSVQLQVKQSVAGILQADAFNTNTGTAAAAVFSARNDMADQAAVTTYGSGYSGTIYGINRARLSEIRLDGTGGAMIDTGSGSSFIYFGTTGATPAMTIKGDNVGIGTSSPSSKLHVAGDAVFDGTVTGGNIAAKYQDIAEWVPAKTSLPAGTVVVIDPLEGNGVLPASQAYDTRIAGVVSAQPGILLGEEGENKVKVAHSGRVRVKVDAQFGSISVGDMLVSSGTAGYAMHSTPVEVGGIAIHRPGTIVGKALEPLTEGQGEILVLLTLQ